MTSRVMCDDATVLYTEYVSEKRRLFILCYFLASRDSCAAVVHLIGFFICTYSYVQLRVQGAFKPDAVSMRKARVRDDS
jgi:hypothetical protein